MLASPAAAQNIVQTIDVVTSCDATEICGRLIDESGHPIELAEIRLVHDGSRLVAISEADGRYTFDRAALSANTTVTVVAIGYEVLQLTTSQLLASNGLIELRTAAMDNSDIVVTAGRTSTPFAPQVISSLDVLTSPVANADSLLAVAALPASTSRDSSADIQLRGGPLGSGRVYFNDIPLYEVVRGSSVDQVTRVSSIFNAAILRDVEIYPTVVPTFLANSAAGAVRIVPQERANNDRSVYIGLPGANVSGSYDLGSEAALQAYAGVTDLAALLAVNPGLRDTTTSFRSIGLGASFRQRFADGSQLRLFSAFDAESARYPLRILNQSGESDSERVRFYGLASFEKTIDDERLRIDAAMSRTSNNLTYLDFATRAANRYIYANVDFAGEALGDVLSYRVGVASEQFRLLSNGSRSFAQPSINERSLRTGSYVAVHSYLTYTPSSNFAIAAGSRHYLHSDPGQQASYMAAATLTSDDRRHRIIAGVGQYGALVVPELGALGQIRAARSLQAAVDYRYAGEALTLSVGAYRKQDDFAGERTQVRGADGSIDFRPNDRLQIVMSFAVSRQRTAGRRSDADLPFLVRGLVRIGIGEMSAFNVGYTLRSGAVFTRVVDGIADGQGGFFPEFDSVTNRQRLGSFQSLDMNLIHRLRFWPGRVKPIAFVSITNALDRSNPSRVVYSSDFQTEQLSYFEPQTLSFGFVFNW